MDGHRPPAGQRVERRLELRRVPEGFPERGDAAAVLGRDRPSERQQPAGGAEVVADVTAAVEELDQLVPAPFSGVGDRRDAGLREDAVRPLDDRRGNAVPE